MKLSNESFLFLLFTLPNSMKIAQADSSLDCQIESPAAKEEDSVHQTKSVVAENNSFELNTGSPAVQLNS